MHYRIISDSSSNLFTLPGVDYTTVPMKVIAGTKEYVDTPSLNVAGMVHDLKHHHGTSGSSCANIGDWLETFEGADVIFCVTISKNVSGSYNAAQQALTEHLEENPGKRGYVFDSLAAGPEQAMLVEKVAQLIGEGCDFDTIVEKTRDYHNHTHTMYRLQSLTNLARNGRISVASAKLAGVLGIRVVGDVKGGRLSLLGKVRGDRKAIPYVVEEMKHRGFYDGALLRIAHCYAENIAGELRDAILREFPNARVMIEPTGALCSFYAEEGGLMIGFEGGFDHENDNRLF